MLIFIKPCRYRFHCESVFDSYWWVAIIFVVTCVYQPFCVKGQKVLPTDLYFQSLSPEQGLLGALSPFMYRDSYDYVWIGSTEGVTRFNGESCQNYQYRPGSPYSLADNNVQSDFFEDKQKDLWFSTYTALNHFSRRSGRMEYFRFKDTLGQEIQTDYRVVGKIANQFLWVRAGDALYEFDLKTQKQVRFLNSFSGIRSVVNTQLDKGIRKVFSANWFKGMGFDVHEYAIDGRFLRSKRHVVALEAVINHLCIKNDSLVWLSVQNTGVLLYNLNTTKVEQMSIDIQPTYILPFLKNYLLVSTKGKGLLLLDKKTLHVLKSWANLSNGAKNTLPPNIYSFYLDPKSFIWVATESKGVFFSLLDQIKFTPVINNAEYPGIFNIRNKIYLLNQRQDVFRFDNQLKQLVQIASKPELNSIYEDRTGTIWLLSKPGIYRLRNGSAFYYSNPPGAGYPRQITELPDGRLIVVYYYGIYEVVGNQINLIDKDISSPSIYIDSKAYVYFNHNSSELTIYKYHHKQFKLLKRLDLGIRVNAYYEDIQQNCLFIGTSSGIYQSEKGNGLNFTKSNLVNGSVYGITKDNQDNIWTASSKGLYCIQRNAKRVFTTLDGLSSNECRDVVVSDRGKILVSTINGVEVADLDSLLHREKDALIKISSLLINYSRTAANHNNLKLRYWQNNIGIYFNSLDYLPNTSYAYKLNHFEQRWITTKDGFANYPSLPPGKYEFLVRSINKNSLWSAQQKLLHIAIVPPFWQMPWFIITLFVFILGTLYIVYRYRIKQIKKQLLFKQKVIESEMKALRAQMNPHFIFNSLNSINAFILANQSKLATQYLTQFANLIRQILDYSSKDVISLEYEIEFLENYLQIESIRLRDKLTYSIEISPEIDTFEIEIPSLVLQPYVENAIWHGISNQPKGGKVSITAKTFSQTLVLSVEDNGVGRAQAQGLAEKSHQSKGLQITAERLALYAEKYHKKVEVQIHDLFNGGIPAGTRVDITIRP